MNVLVTGGAGYIGSHTVVELINAGMRPVIVDNLCNSRIEVMGRLAHITGRKIPFHQVDITDTKALSEVFAKEKPHAVIHFAGHKAVSTSMEKPLSYYRNNVVGTLSVAEVMVEHDVHQIVFSSSATIYGEPVVLPIKEDHPIQPINPYGHTKVKSEQILRDQAGSNPNWKVTLLRYFNPSGAHESGMIGEDPQREPDNLSPYIAQVLAGRLPHLKVFGNDYDTHDGTGVRDYLHVVDLAKAHVKALYHQKDRPGVHTFNLGTGRGHSVFEMIRSFEKAAGKNLLYQMMPRRPGDMAACYADATKAEKVLGWKAEKTLDDMTADSWRWQSMNPNGYANAPLFA